ncbi:MAG: hypothetical protein AAGD10_05050 [Myxococcota bacterium]
MSRLRLPLAFQWRSLSAPFAKPVLLPRGIERTPILLTLPPMVEQLETYGRLAAVRCIEAARAQQRVPVGVAVGLRCPRDGRQGWINGIRRGLEDVLGRFGLELDFGVTEEGPLLLTLAVEAKARPKALSLPRAGQKLWLTRPLGSDVLVEAFHRQVRTASQTRQWLEKSDHPGPPGPRGERVLGSQVGLQGLAGAALSLALSAELDVVLDAGALPAWPGALEHLFAGVQPLSCELNARILGRRFLVTRGVSERAAQLALASEWTGGILWASDRTEKGVCVGQLRKPRHKPVARLLRALQA